MKVNNTEVDIESMTDEELHTHLVFLKGRIKINVFVSEESKEKTYADFQEVSYEVERRAELEKKK